jgi:hypothetical protein
LPQGLAGSQPLGGRRALHHEALDERHLAFGADHAKKTRVDIRMQPNKACGPVVV